MKCGHCNEELGQGDEYELLKAHAYYCNSPAGRAVMRARDASDGHTMYCQCKECV